MKGEDTMESSIEGIILKKTIGDWDEKWLNETRAK